MNLALLPDYVAERIIVIGGVVIPEQVWHRIRDALVGMKVRRRLRGELKWRYFAPNNHDLANPMHSMSPSERDEIRTETYEMICSVKSIKSMACVACIEAAYAMQAIGNRDDLYHFTDKPLSERFQYYLQDLSRLVGEAKLALSLRIIEVQRMTRGKNFSLRRENAQTD